MPKTRKKPTPKATATTTALEKRIAVLEAEVKNKSRFALIISTVNQVIATKDNPKEAIKALQSFVSALQRTLE